MTKEEILKASIPKDCYWEEMDHLTNCPAKHVYEAMDLYAQSREAELIAKLNLSKTYQVHPLVESGVIKGAKIVEKPLIYPCNENADLRLFCRAKPCVCFEFEKSQRESHASALPFEDKAEAEKRHEINSHLGPWGNAAADYCYSKGYTQWEIVMSTYVDGIEAYKAALREAIDHELSLIGEDDDDEYDQGLWLGLKKALELIETVKPKIDNLNKQ